ncbi:hypothetical protein EBX93_05505, partial [bacterium]|nr:hypothetical protein [bacterium]
MAYNHLIRGERFNFPDLGDLLAKANEPKSGDLLAGIAAKNERERIAAKMALADLPLKEFLSLPVIDPDSDDVSKLHTELVRTYYACARFVRLYELLTKPTYIIMLDTDSLVRYPFNLPSNMYDIHIFEKRHR